MVQSWVKIPTLLCQSNVRQTAIMYQNQNQICFNDIELQFFLCFVLFLMVWPMATQCCSGWLPLASSHSPKKHACNQRCGFECECLDVCLSLCGPLVSRRLVRGVTLPSPAYDGWERLQLTHMTLSAGGSGYRKWMDGLAHSIQSKVLLMGIFLDGKLNKNPSLKKLGNILDF